MARIAASEARENFATILNEVAFGGERTGSSSYQSATDGMFTGGRASSSPSDAACLTVSRPRRPGPESSSTPWASVRHFSASLRHGTYVEGSKSRVDSPQMIER